MNAYGDKIGTGRSFLNLNTWAEKCTFESERFLYCAVPTQLDRGAAFAPALYENMPDEIYKIDLQTGIKTQIPISDDKTVKDMFLSPDKQNLYFTDTSENGLFKIDL